jgi:formylglycine-generating enzyme required for sulfatase activity
MSHLQATVLVVLASVLTLAASAVRADVFNMPNGEASVQFVPVGAIGNAPDPATGSLYGSVGYTYDVGKYDVTVGQYCQFLNAVAATDTYGLYDSNMGTDYATVGITQSGSPGSYTYSVSYPASAWNPYVAYNSSLYPSALAAANDAPVFDVSWGDAARFANWLQNGQPANLGEAAGSTETGAYSLGGATSQHALMAIGRNAGATDFIPSENEWYKAAYFNPSNSTYWTYPTPSNSAPSNVLSATGTNNANFYNGGYTDPTNDLTPVGAFAGSPGPFGTYDMGGDLFQWNEADYDNGNLYRGLRGGGWFITSSFVESSGRYYYGSPTGEYYYGGFRVASVPTGWVHPDPGDANGDGKVDINDLTIVLTDYDKTAMAWSQGDFTGDGTVDVNDLSIVLANFGTTYGPAGLAALPEPSSFLLIAFAVVGLVACRRGRCNAKITSNNSAWPR